MIKKITKLELVSEIKSLGVETGDVVFLAADLMRVGYFNVNRQRTLSDWVEILMESVGPEGTLIIPSYTESFFIWKKNKNIVFDEFCQTTSGSLSVAFQNYPGVKRSKHPTNSCFAIGRYADYILDGHDESASSYYPYSKIINMGGKNLMIGTFYDTRLSPMAIHSAQEAIGLLKKNWASGLLQSYFVDLHQVTRLFTRFDIGGCTAGGYKTIGHHLIAGAINFGKVGKSNAALIDCSKSFDIFLNILKNEPKFLRCCNKYCPDCYGSPVSMHPIFWCKFLLRRIYNKFIKN